MSWPWWRWGRVASDGFTLRTASNTGLLGAGIAEGGLSSQGSITYSTANDGQTITGKKFTGTVTVNANNLTISGCLFEFTPDTNTYMLRHESGSNLTLVDCTFRCTSATSGVTWGVMNRQSGFVMRRCDVSGAENCLTTYGDNCLVEDSFLHFPSSADPAGHNDTIEVYGGTDIIIRRNTILLDQFGFSQSPTEPINVAPWSGSNNVVNLTIESNYIDGDYFGPILLDTNQAGTHDVTNVRIIKNRFGGHSSGGDYGGILNIGGGMTRVSTDTAGVDEFYCPYTGPDANYWWYCRNNPFGFPDLTPDRQGQLYAG